MARRDGPSNSSTVTLADVARHVGVSARTVSRVVNDEGGCTADTRARILQAIEELGYRPNLMARALIRRRSDTVGLINATMIDPFFPEFADGVERALAEAGRTMFVATSGGDPDRQRRALNSFLGRGVDGAIMFHIPGTEDDLIRFAADGLAIVAVNTELQAHGISTVNAEIRNGAEAAVEHLLERGRRRIVMLVDETAATATERSRREVGYRSVLAEAGYASPDIVVIEAANSLPGGRNGAQRALAIEPRPDAIFAYNDVMAIGALQYCLEAGARVPDDVAIVGFDDILMCEAMTPALTTVRIDRHHLARAAVESLSQLVATGEPATRHLPVELVVREST